MHDAFSSALGAVGGAAYTKLDSSGGGGGGGGGVYGPSAGVHGGGGGGSGGAGSPAPPADVLTSYFVARFLPHEWLVVPGG